MSNRQKAQQAALQAARKNHEKTKEVFSKEKDDSILPEFAEEAKVENEMVVEKQDEDLSVQDFHAETDEAPNQVEEARAKEEISTRVNIQQLKADISASASIVIDQILNYMKAVPPGKPVELKAGAKEVASFWAALKIMFNNLDDRDFPIVYRAVLNLFDEHKDGVLADEMVYRFAEEWPMTEADRAAYRRLVNLMLVTRHAATRRQDVKSLKNWDYILEFGLTERAKNRIRNFYDL